MRCARCAAALGLVIAMAFGCGRTATTTSRLEDIPEASGLGVPYRGLSPTLGTVDEGPRRIFGIEPPELLPPGSEELPLPSRVTVLKGERPKTIDRVLGRVNKDIITLSEVQELAQPFIARIRSQVPPERQEEEIRRVQSALLDRIIDLRLQVQLAERLGVEASDKDLDEAVADVMANNNMTPEQFDLLLAREGITIDQYREKLREQIVRRRVYNFEVVSRVQVSDADVQDYYLSHIKEFIPPPAVEISQIFIALPANGDEAALREVDQKVAGVMAALERGEPLGVVARAKSDDPTGSRGGRVGRFKRGEMVPDLEKVAFEMREGEIRGPIATDRGFHVLKVDKRWGDKPLPLEQIASQIRAKLLDLRRGERYKEWIETLRGDAFIERADLGKAPAEGR